MTENRIQEKSRSPTVTKSIPKNPFKTVSFSSIIFSIDGKKQYTRGLGSVAPQITITTIKKEKR